MEMNTQYFINKFEAIPEERWTIHEQIDETGRRCALGHLLPEEYTSDKWDDIVLTGSDGFSCGSHTVEGKELVKIFGNPFIVADINNGSHPSYQQNSPKQRILAALRDMQVKEQQDKAVEEVNHSTIMPICPECGRPTNQCTCEETEDGEDEDWGVGEVREVPTQEAELV